MPGIARTQQYVKEQLGQADEKVQLAAVFFHNLPNLCLPRYPDPATVRLYRA